MVRDHSGRVAQRRRTRPTRVLRTLLHCSRSSPGRYQKGSIILATNRNVAAWGDIFSNSTIAAAMLDRLLHRSVAFIISGDSYRLHAYQAQARKQRPKGDRN